MASTSPDNILTPDLGDQYALTQDLGLMADSIQAALAKRANSYVGTTAQRTAFTTAPEGVQWTDTNGTRSTWTRRSGVWVGGDTGWLNITLASGLTSAGAGRTPQVRTINNTTWLRGGIAASTGSLTTGAYVQFCTLAAIHRPLATTPYMAAGAASAVGAFVACNPAGVGQFYLNSAAAWVDLGGISWRTD